MRKDPMAIAMKTNTRGLPDVEQIVQMRKEQVWREGSVPAESTLNHDGLQAEDFARNRGFRGEMVAPRSF